MRFSSLLLTIFFFLGASVAEEQTASSDHIAPLSDSEIDKILDDAEGDEAQDPLERLNRILFQLNRVLDGLILKPVATLYNQAVHDDIKDSLENIVDTVFMPSSAINYLLQGKGEKAIEALMRTVLNMLFGFGGIFDVAKHAGLHSNPTDMNATLTSWGVQSGPYLMLPALGPTTFRGAVGMLGDLGTSPWTWVVEKLKEDRIPWRNRLLAMYFLDLVQRREKVLDLLNDIEKTSVDPYVTIRSLFLQNEREKEKKMIEYVGPPQPHDERHN